MLCSKCKKSYECREPFPQDECDKYEERVTNKLITDLFWGMSSTMQHSIIEIMKTTQVNKEKK